MTIKDVIMSGIAINDALMSSIAHELCDNDSNNNNTMCNLKHVKSFVELAVLASKKSHNEHAFAIGNLNAKTNTNINTLLKKRREKFVLIRGFAFQ